MRHEHPVPRPRKPKDIDDDDAPVYVDEETNEALSKEDYEQLVNGTEGKDESTDKDKEGLDKLVDSSNTKSTETAGEDTKPQQNLAEIGTQKKRRKAKVIQEDEVLEDESRTKDSSATSKPSAKSSAKRKKIKLSFEEPE